MLKKFLLPLIFATAVLTAPAAGQLPGAHSWRLLHRARCARGELVQLSTPEGTLNYSYHAGSGAKERVWTAHSDLRYTYDAMNRLKTVAVHKRNGVELGTPEVTTYDYTKVGSRASVSLPNGIITSYQYDSLNRLTNLTHKKADTLIASYTYSLLPVGRRSAVAEVTPAGTSQINYTYDNLYRLTGESRTGVNPFTASYAYDINSNRTQKEEIVNGTTETVNYHYNANDQLTSEVSDANGTVTYQYDANGSLTMKENPGKFRYQYGYDLRNRLTSANITRKEGGNDVAITSSYAYNTDGIRTRALQTINGITQNRYFLLDSGHTGCSQVFEETSMLGGNAVRSYVLGDDVLSQNVNGITSHLLYDGHGNTRQLANNNGAVTANYAYDAYGKMLGGNPGVTDGKQSATDLLYAGEQFDPGLQMEYLRARYYDQDNGRFNRLDPFGGNSDDPQSLHKYAYAHCDPVNGVDPSGELSIVSIFWTAYTWGIIVAPVAMKISVIGSFSFALLLALSIITMTITEEGVIYDIAATTGIIASYGLMASGILHCVASLFPTTKIVKAPSPASHGNTPAQQASNDQITYGYKVDRMDNGILKKGSVIGTGVPHGFDPQRKPKWAFNIKDILGTRLSPDKLQELTQTSKTKGHIQLFIAKDDIPVAYGTASANMDKGPGGSQQIFIPDSSKLQPLPGVIDLR